MVLTGNAGLDPPYGLRAEGNTNSADARRSYPNTKTCRSKSYTHPTDSDADAAYADPCSTDGDTCPTFSNPGFPGADLWEPCTLGGSGDSR